MYKTLDNIVDDRNKAYQETLPDILFMCVEKPKLLQLCDLFPQTAENIRERARERRVRFMQQKNTNSIRYDEKQEAHRESIDKDDHKEAHEFYSDEEPENQAS